MHVVAVRAPSERAGEVRSALLDLAARAGARPRFATGEPDLEVSESSRVSVLTLAIPDADDSPGAEQSLRELRGTLVPETVGRVPGASVAVGGGTAASVDFSGVLSARLPFVIAFVLGLTFLLVLVSFRSVVVAATAIALNLLSVAAAYGLLVLVFQHTWARICWTSGPTGRSSRGCRCFSSSSSSGCPWTTTSSW